MIGRANLSADLLYGDRALDAGVRAADRAKAGDRDPEKVRKAARDMEAGFLFQLLSALRKTVPDESKEGSANERDLYREMFDQAVAEKAAARGGVGLADLIVARLAARDGEGEGAA
ncbi:MAG: rod-binding protein, partial [Candidatus Methylomirabilis sp.]|nr:rod-binding protein [Deltaproteobacteria bacterium]